MLYDILVDAGSSKVEWSVISADCQEVMHDTCAGVNALAASPHDLRSLFARISAGMARYNTPRSLSYYGAGCATRAVCLKVGDAIESVFGKIALSVESDLLAAARSLLGDKPGIACILGTGSNSCLYDGENITDHVPALGYLLGDEGSGAVIGRRLISDFLKRQLDSDIADKFLDATGLTQEHVLEEVYRGSAPGRFLASVVPFIKQHLDNPQLDRMVREELGRFLDRNVCAYQGWQSIPVSFTGGVAYNFADLLREECRERGINVGNITARPLEGLIEYHNHKNAILNGSL